MEVNRIGIKSYPQDPTRYFDFSRFSKEAGNFILIEGFIDFDILCDFKRKGKKIVYLEFEEPNRFFVTDPKFNHFGYENMLDKIFTICPYTAKWLNKKYSNRKRTPIFFPFNEELIPNKNEKKYDIVYTGHINSKEILDNIKTISNFNYRFVSNSSSEFVTDSSADYLTKLDIISKSKITLVHNLLFVNPKQLKVLYSVENYYDDKAFIKVPKRSLINGGLLWYLKNEEILVPHLKSRMFEAAFCHSLILCRKDPFNLIEEYFEPDKEFVYFDEGKLEEKIIEVLGNYKKYEVIVENAYKRAIRKYTTKIFFDKYLKFLY